MIVFVIYTPHCYYFLNNIFLFFLIFYVGFFISILLVLNCTFIFYVILFSAKLFFGEKYVIQINTSLSCLIAQCIYLSSLYILGLTNNASMHIHGKSGRQCFKNLILSIQYFPQTILSSQEVDKSFHNPPSLFILSFRTKNISETLFH